MGDSLQIFYFVGCEKKLKGERELREGGKRGDGGGREWRGMVRTTPSGTFWPLSGG